MHRGASASGVLVSGTDADLLGRAERSSPEALQGRAVGAGLDGECAHRAIIDRAAMRAVSLGFLG
jgi:hypothetical protein